MSGQPLSDKECQQAVDTLLACDGNKTQAAERIGIPVKTFSSRVQIAKARGFVGGATPKPFELDELPDGDEPIEELLERRTKAFMRKDRAETARKLINVRVKIDGPFSITHFGDPHVDDDGCDLPMLRRHIEVINSTEGMFGANVGDLQNNWIGRLGYLYGQQELSKKTAWRLTEWLVGSVQWLYLVKGNHDNWSGEGDPLNWLMRQQPGAFDDYGVRLNLICPNGRNIRINARHDFAGHSMWNTTHGPLKAAMMGWRDHILSCGHKHTSGYQLVKDPASGLISHVLRCAGFKKHDHYAKEKGFPDAAFYPSATTIIDPTRDETDVGMITVIHDIERASQFLSMLRKGKKAA